MIFSPGRAAVACLFFRFPGNIVSRKRERARDVLRYGVPERGGGRSGVIGTECPERFRGGGGKFHGYCGIVLRVVFAEGASLCF